MCCNEGWYRKVEYVTLTDIFINTVSTHVLPAEIVYADDVDFVSHSVQLLREHETRAASTLAGWSLAANQSRTEYAHIVGERSNREGMESSKETWFSHGCRGARG